MKDKSFGKSAKNVSESDMSTTALLKGREYYDALMDAEYRGRKDRNGSARSRLADDMGVNESKLLRLEYRIEEMRDIGGELFRRLSIWYAAICEGDEQAAAEMRAERLRLKEERLQKRQRHAVGKGPSSDGMGMGAPHD